MEEFNSQYDEIGIHFVRSYPDMVSDPDEIIIGDIKRPRKTEALCTYQLIVMVRPVPPSE